MIVLPEKQIYRFEGVEVDLSRGCLLRNGKERHLRQKAFQVLTYLLENHDRLVTKGELFEMIWKDTAVTDDVLVQCVKEIRRAIDDDPHQPRFIKTVPKSGYRFIGSLEHEPNDLFFEEITKVEIEYEEDFETAASLNSPVKILPHVFASKTRRHFLLPAVLLLIIVVGLGFYFSNRSALSPEKVRLPQIEGKKTIAVMFFENQSNNTELDWLREGLTDMLIANLSRSERLTVLSRSQLYSLTESRGWENSRITMDQAQAIARQTQAEYFMTGSFAKIGDRMRLDVQLYDSNSAQLLATETLTVDKPEQVLTEIDLLSLKILNRLKTAPAEKQNLAGVMTDNLEAYRFYSLAVEKTQALQNKEAIELLEKAIALDPQFAMAYARMGYVYSISAGHSIKGKPYLEKAFTLSDRLTEKDRLSIKAWYEIANLDFNAAIRTYREIIAASPLETESYWRLGRILEGEGKIDEAIEVLKQGLNIDRNSKIIYNTLGGIYSRSGKHGEAVTAHQRYVVLAPNEANAYDSLGMSYQWSGDYSQAIENYQRSLELNPNFEIAVVHLANTYFQLGQYRKAENLYHRYIEIAPTQSEKERGWSCLTRLYIKKRDFAAAERSLNEFEKLNNTEKWLSYWLAAEKGDPVRARHLEKMVFPQNPNNDRGSRVNRRHDLFYHGYISLQNGQADEAIKYLRQGIESKPPTWDIDPFEDSLANAYLRLGRLDEAIAEYQRVLRLNPSYPLVYFHLAKAYQGKGLTVEAQDYYRKFLETWKEADSDIPEIMIARQALDKLGITAILE